MCWHYSHSHLLVFLVCVSNAFPVPLRMVCMCCFYSRSCFLACLACICTMIAVISLHCLLWQRYPVTVVHCLCVSVEPSQLPPCAAHTCWHNGHSCLFALLVCVSNAVVITFSHDLNIQHYNQRHLHVLLVCVGSAIPVTFSYGLCASTLQLQSPPCTTSILAVQPDSPFHVARACGQCCARYHHAMLACDSPGACLAAARNDISDGMSQLLHWLDLLCSRCLKSARSWHVRQ